MLLGPTVKWWVKYTSHTTMYWSLAQADRGVTQFLINFAHTNHRGAVFSTSGNDRFLVIDRQVLVCNIDVCLSPYSFHIVSMSMSVVMYYS